MPPPPTPVCSPRSFFPPPVTRRGFINTRTKLGSWKASRPSVQMCSLGGKEVFLIIGGFPCEGGLVKADDSFFIGGKKKKRNRSSTPLEYSLMEQRQGQSRL